MKKILSIIFALALLPITLMGSGCTPNSKPSAPEEDYVYEVSKDGKYVYIGQYPQSLKKENVTIQGMPNELGYYKGSDGAWYAKQKVMYDNIDLIAADGREMFYGEEYYFKVEKLKWKVLENENGEMYLVADNALAHTMYREKFIMSYLFDYRYQFCAVDENGSVIYNGERVVEANNYKYSDLRKFLAEDFYNQAFNEEQKQYLNKITNPFYSSVEDYVYTLNRDDYSNESYGMLEEVVYDDKGNYVSGGPTEKMIFKATDYAKATGVSVLSESVLEDLKEAFPQEYLLIAKFINCGIPWTAVEVDMDDNMNVGGMVEILFWMSFEDVDVNATGKCALPTIKVNFNI